jgi:hypothetical protein
MQRERQASNCDAMLKQTTTASPSAAAPESRGVEWPANEAASQTIVTWNVQLYLPESAFQ